MENSTGITQQIDSNRREWIAGLLGGALIAGAMGSGQAQAQTLSSVDTVPLQLLTNLFYPGANYAIGVGGPVIADNIRAGDISGQPGVAAVGPRVIPASTTVIRARINEIAAPVGTTVSELLNRLVSIRAFLRAEAPAQKQLDLTPATFTTMLRLAGAIDATTTFDPYANEGNYVLGLFALTDYLPSVLRGMVPLFTNDVIQAWLSSSASAFGNNCANIRAMLVQLGATRPELLTMADRLAAWQDQISGVTSVDRRVTPTGTGASAIANLNPTDADGLFPARTAQQALNILFMSRTAVSQGGFYPTGINGTITTSAAN